MKRRRIQPRKNWQEKVEETGLLFHHTQEGLYWDESAYYEFNTRQIDELDDAAEEVHRLCLRAVQHVIDHNRFEELGIPPEAIPVIRQSWIDREPSLYGRFDFAYDGVNPPKMLEYNADTPTALLEASVTQWYWLRESFGEDSDQFNSIHEELLTAWPAIRRRMKEGILHLTCVEGCTEDLVTATYLRDTAIQSGMETDLIFTADIGWDNRYHRFVDLEGSPMRNIFKLYPWEWLLRDPFGPDALVSYQSMCWLEPIWKMVLSNKGILPILWELNPGHPNLLESHFDRPKGFKEYVCKPKLSREGANITVVTDKGGFHTGGTYEEEGRIYQELFPIPCIDGNYPVPGCWIVDGRSAGMGIRESRSIVTDNYSRFVPHLFG